MKTLKELLIIGPGPSSSHTIGPYRICLDFLIRIKNLTISKIKVTLYASLALTGKGHGTDKIIQKALKNYSIQIVLEPKLSANIHPNTMKLEAFCNEKLLLSLTYLSIGGGAYEILTEKKKATETYPFNTFSEMKSYLPKFSNDIYNLIEYYEGHKIFDYGQHLLTASFKTIERALVTDGILPGPLKLKRVSKQIYLQALKVTDSVDKRDLLLTSYSYATSEANAAGEEIVTAPTCGAAGVVPAVLYYLYHDKQADWNHLVKAYLVGALIANFIKQNASISGAVAGCQAEIGSAASFASAALAYYFNLSIYQIEYAAEVSMEHFLGLTCDPVDGYVQIPCIERNAVASIHAVSAFLFSKDIAIYRHNRVSFDEVVLAMREIGKEIPSDLKETSKGGLAKIIC